MSISNIGDQHWNDVHATLVPNVFGCPSFRMTVIWKFKYYLLQRLTWWPDDEFERNSLRTSTQLCLGATEECAFRPFGSWRNLLVVVDDCIVLVGSHERVHTYLKWPPTSQLSSAWLLMFLQQLPYARPKSTTLKELDWPMIFFLSEETIRSQEGWSSINFESNYLYVFSCAEWVFRLNSMYQISRYCIWQQEHQWFDFPGMQEGTWPPCFVHTSTMCVGLLHMHQTIVLGVEPNVAGIVTEVLPTYTVVYGADRIFNNSDINHWWEWSFYHLPYW